MLFLLGNLIIIGRCDRRLIISAYREILRYRWKICGIADMENYVHADGYVVKKVAVHQPEAWSEK